MIPETPSRGGIPRLEEVFPFEYEGGGHFRRNGVPKGTSAETLHGAEAVRYLYWAMVREVLPVRLPDWAWSLRPDRRSRTLDRSWLFEWFGPNRRAIDFYDCGDVVAIGVVEGAADGFHETSMADREWIENFAEHGWRDSNPSLSSHDHARER